MRKRRHRINIEIGKKLRAVRESRHLTQEEAAKLMGILRTSLINIEYGRQGFPVELLLQFAEVYDVDFVTLLPEQKVA